MTSYEESQGAANSFGTVDWEGVRRRHARIDRARYPRLEPYGWDTLYRGAMGPGGLYLAADMADRMALRPASECSTLAVAVPSRRSSSREYGVKVVAADLWIAPSENWPVIEEAGLQDFVFPLHVDARKLPFAEHYFDAMFCMDSFFYYGTDDFFLRSLVKYFKAGAVLCIGGPCYRDGYTPDDSVLFHFSDSVGYHSPRWWKEHFDRSGVVEDVVSVEHPLGAELWEDYVLYSMENADNDPNVRNYVDKDVEIIEANRDRLLTHFIMTAHRRP